MKTQAHTDSQQEQPVTSLSVSCLVLWTSTCLCVIALFKKASTHILRAFYSADIGINTNTTSNLGSTYVVLALVAGGRAQRSASPQQSTTNAAILVSAAFQSAILLSMTVNIASRCIASCGADCILRLMQYLYDPGISQSSANQCILGKAYLRSNLLKAHIFNTREKFV